MQEIQQGYFDPENHEDAREKMMRSIVHRQGQGIFRSMLLKSYQYKCAISECDARQALEAAHIMPYNGSKTNHITNGLLLRADLHTLFDRGLFTIDPENWTVTLSDSLRNTMYKDFDRKKIYLPSNPKHRPSQKAFQYRNSKIRFDE